MRTPLDDFGWTKATFVLWAPGRGFWSIRVAPFSIGLYLCLHVVHLKADVVDALTFGLQVLRQGRIGRRAGPVRCSIHRS